MVLTIDIGNTTVAFALFKKDDDEPLFVERIESDNKITSDAYKKNILEIFKKHNIDKVDIKGAVLSSVVPKLTDTLVKAVSNSVRVSTFVVNTKTDIGLKFKYCDTSTLGNDRVVDAVSALSKFKPPLVILDMGTATTVSVLDAKGYFIGGMIMPGPRLFIEALSTKTAQLPRINIEKMKLSGVIANNTADCLLNGAIIGIASAIDGVISRIEEELQSSVTIVATGGHCKKILPWCKRDINFDEHLLLKGLYRIYCQKYSVSPPG